MFIDVHLHTIRSPGLPRNAGGERFATPDELVAMMDKTGVDVGVLLPGASPEFGGHGSTSHDVLEVCRAYPDRFLPFCNVDPRHDANSAATDFTRHLEYYKAEGCKGVGELTANLAFTDPLVLNLFEHCQACRMPVIFHVATQFGGTYGLIDDLNQPGLERCLRLFPDLVFIGHSQAFWSEVDGAVTAANRGGYPTGKVEPGGSVPRLMRAYPTLYGDISAGSGYNALTRDPEFGVAFANEFHDRLFFGTDICSPTNDHRHAELLRTWHDEGKLGDEAFENITWRNANRVLELGF